ncbi:MAG TPA: zinc-binding alcohol dehydrogenase family protein [Verrucomicrobiae bacterium]|nr:zinc-binding alcohol dehydrogenase family protein [Verrucomicrobiae bacterium]
MKAVRFSAFANNLENLSVEQIPDPVLHPGEVKIRILAACINPSDVKNLEGRMASTTLPRTPGRDFAGIVVDGPSNLHNVEVWGSGGDIGFSRDGSHAEFLVIPAEAVSAKPRNLSFEDAACVGVNFLTAYKGLFQRANLQQGETLLVTGAQGGVGSAVLQLGHTQNAKLIAVDRKPQSKQLDGIQLLGYVDSSSSDLKEAVQEITKGRGVDVAFDCVGGELFEPVLSTLRRLGRQVAITSAGNRRVSFDLVDFYHRRLTLFGVDSVALTVTDGAGLLSSLSPLFEAGVLKPAAIAKRGSLDEARQLYSHVASGRAGKAVFLSSIPS